MATRDLAIVLLLVAGFLIVTSTGVYATPAAATPITLFAHAPISNATVKGPILNAVPERGPQQAAPLREEPVFTLNPPLGGDSHFEGTITMSLWVRADNRLTGFLQLGLTELTADGLNRTIPGLGFDNVPVSLDTRPHAENFAALVNFTVAEGSRIQLRVKLVTDDRITGAYLLYDSALTPTQIVIPFMDAGKATVGLMTPAGGLSRIFLTKGETNATILARINVTDYIGLYRLSSASLTISNEQGNDVATIANILSTERIADQYTATLSSTLNLPSGTYTITITVTDKTGNTYPTSDRFYVSPSYSTNIRIVDEASNSVVNAGLTAATPAGSYEAQTNQTGWATLELPSSNFVGQYAITITWKNTTSGPYVIPVNGDQSITIGIPAIDVTINVRLLGFSLGDAEVGLYSGSHLVSSNITDFSGNVEFAQLPRGNYTAQVQYLLTAFRTQMLLDKSGTETINVPFPFRNELPFFIVLVAAAAAVSLVMHRRKLYEAPLGFINVLTRGGVPDSCTAVIAGGSGSGKTVLLESLADRSVKTGRGCVYVTNVELPSNVRRTSAMLGVDLGKHENEGNLAFIDCYSALSGTQSKEKRALSSITDLTSLGILITAAIEEMGKTTDVYVDSLTPLFTTLKPDYVLSFLQSIGAKVKSNNGRLTATIGSSVEKETLTRIEEISDVVVETQLLESRSGQKRRLRIKKLRSHSYIDTWVPFRISDRQGITFLTHKSYAESDLK